MATISRAHIAAGTVESDGERGDKAGAKRDGATSARQDQALVLRWNEVKEFIDSAGEGLRADRERALLCVAYERWRGGIFAFVQRLLCKAHPKYPEMH